MTKRTISEGLFEGLCDARGVRWHRIPEGDTPTPDYEIALGAQPVIVEIKQLDPNERDKEVNQALLRGEGVVNGSTVARRLRQQIASAYRQLKPAARKGQPCLLVVYNNAGRLSFIDSFTITTAMFGTYGVHIGLTRKDEVREIGRGFTKNRRLQRNECRGLSAIAVLDGRHQEPRVEAYHNPFALVPIDPRSMAALATAQFRHPNPHERGSVGAVRSRDRARRCRPGCLSNRPTTRACGPQESRLGMAHHVPARLSTTRIRRCDRFHRPRRSSRLTSSDSPRGSRASSRASHRSSGRCWCACISSGTCEVHRCQKER